MTPPAGLWKQYKPYLQTEWYDLTKRFIVFVSEYLASKLIERRQTETDVFLWLLISAGYV